MPFRADAAPSVSLSSFSRSLKLCLYPFRPCSGPSPGRQEVIVVRCESSSPARDEGEDRLEATCAKQPVGKQTTEPRKVPSREFQRRNPKIEFVGCSASSMGGGRRYRRG